MVKGNASDFVPYCVSNYDMVGTIESCCFDVVSVEKGARL